MRKIHSFEENGDSCILSNARPPRYWHNQLFSVHGYCAQVSQIGHGKSYYLNEKADMCQLNYEESRFIYLRDDKTNVSWNIGEGPLLTPVTNYSCEHNISFTKIQSQKDGMYASFRIFVPFDGFHEVMTISLKNLSHHEKHLSVFSVMGFELEGFQYPRYYHMSNTCDTFFDQNLNGIFCQSRHPYAPHKRYNAYIACSETVSFYEGDMNAFLGPLGSFARPETLLFGRDCSNSTCCFQRLGGVLQNKITLKPNEEKEIHILCGVSESLEEATAAVNNIFNQDIYDLLQLTKEFWQTRYGELRIKTPDPKINHLMNNWVKKQIEFCIIGKKGVRDNLQIAVGMLNYLQGRAKAEILEVLKHQFQDGHGVLTWYPYDDTRYSDQPFWIVWAVIELIKETGDFSILNESVAYQYGGMGTVFEHMQRAIHRLLEDVGPNGLTKIFFADWNDALNITTDPEAESVMLSEQLCLALKDFAILSQKYGQNEYALYLEQQYDHMKDLINEKAWDGEWYVRALSKDENIGSKSSSGAKIYLNAQTWAVLADIPDEMKLNQVIVAIDDMEHEFGFPICKPPNMEYSPLVGRMSGMLPGIHENGAVYNHATAFKIFMDCKLGRAEDALRSLLKIMPDSEYNPSMRSGADPYVFTSCYNTHTKYYGKSFWSWTTGTSAWSLRGLYEGILGLRRDYAGLKIEPVLVNTWVEVNIFRTFRGTKYDISMINNGTGEVKIFVDNLEISGNILPLFDDHQIHKVQVYL